MFRHHYKITHAELTALPETAERPLLANFTVMPEIPFSEITESFIDESGRVNLTKKVLEALGWKAGDKVALRTVKDEGKVEILKPKIVLALATMAMLMSLSIFIVPNVSAQAQEGNATSTDTTGTGPETPSNFGPGGQVSIAGGNRLKLSLANGAAHLPFRLEITYPSGIGDIWNVTRLSPTSVYNVNDSVGGLGVGTTSKIFTTGTPDTFTIRVGQRYPTPINQVVAVTAYANNTQVMPQTLIPIEGDNFEFIIEFTTTVPPHYPTDAELNAGVYQRLDQLAADFGLHQDETHTTNRNVGLAANGFSLSIMPNVAMTILSLLNFVGVVYVLRKLRGSGPVITIGGKKDDKKDAKQKPKDEKPGEKKQEPVKVEPAPEPKPEPQKEPEKKQEPPAQPVQKMVQSFSDFFRSNKEPDAK